MILKQLEEKEPLPDKEKDQMAWVSAAKQHRAIAEEIMLAGQTAKAAADDGLFPPIFARVNKAGTPVAGLIIG